jgi:hypothetical protein
MDSIVQVLRNLTLFLLFSYLLTNLFSGSKYQKYIYYAIGLIAIVLVVKPFFQLIIGEDSIGKHLDFSLQKVEDRDFKEQLKMVEEKGQKKLLVEYKDKIEKQIQRENNSYGDIKEVSVELDSDGTVKNVEVKLKADSDFTSKISQNIANQYGISKEDVTVESAR